MGRARLRGDGNEKNAAGATSDQDAPVDHPVGLCTRAPLGGIEQGVASNISRRDLATGVCHAAPATLAA